MGQGQASRRATQRAELLADIRTEAYKQIGASGLAGMSMSAIAQNLGLSTAALYRYFPSRDALVRVLLSESVQANAQAVMASLESSRGQSALVQLRHLLQSMHKWAVVNPVQYAVVSGGIFGSDQALILDPEVLSDVRVRPLHAICALVAALPNNVGAPIRRALESSAIPAATTCPQLSGFAASDIAFGMVIYSRLHGAVALQIAEVWQRHGIDADRVFDIELDLLLPETS
jgi:AcrR family transcriptional regulator